MGAFLAKLFVDPKDLPDNGFGMVQLLFLGMCYAKILSTGGQMIGDGSELLLLVPSLAGLVGSIVLPVLGAVPDAMIIIFSALGGGDKKEVQRELNVGMGALAGSTICLLTVPWTLAMVAGRVDFDPDGKGNYKKPQGASADWSKLTEGRPFFQTGVNVNDKIKHAAFSMVLTMLSMFVIQIPACFSRCSLADEDSDCDTPKWAALTAGVLCSVFFAWYLYDQYRRAGVDIVLEDRIRRVQEHSLADRIMSARVMFGINEGGDEMQARGGAGASDALLPATSGPKFESFVRRIFVKYDHDKSGSIDKAEIALLLKDLGEKHDEASVDRYIKEVDQDNDGKIDFKEFFSAMSHAAVKSNTKAAAKAAASAAAGGESGGGQREGRPSSGFGTQVVTGGGNEGEEGGNNNVVARASDGEGSDESEEEEEEVPEDLANLPPDEQRRRVILRSLWQMGLGTVLVVVFSDPMVDILNNFAGRIHIKPFYVAFILAPVVSNGSEIIAAFGYASKKTIASATISFSTLLGAACMNNTLCMAVFLFLVAAQDLKWVFTAEVACMIFCELVMFGLVVFCGRSLKSQWLILVVLLFPASLALVAGLEAGGLD